MAVKGWTRLLPSVRHALTERSSSDVPDGVGRVRRRIYLMRHGDVDYFDADGTPRPPDSVALNPAGRAQADAAGALFASAGVRVDRVITSGLARTLETAERVLARAGLTLVSRCEPRLDEIRPGRLSATAPAQLRSAFVDAFATTDLATVGSQRFLGGESVDELLDRVLPAFDEILRDEGWDTLLLVLHGAVNRALLSHALTGGRAFFGRIEQAPACINVIDQGAKDLIVRAVNLAPTQWLHADDGRTTMERLLAQYVEPALRQGERAG